MPGRRSLGFDTVDPNSKKKLGRVPGAAGRGGKGGATLSSDLRGRGCVRLPAPRGMGYLYPVVGWVVDLSVRACVRARVCVYCIGLLRTASSICEPLTFSCEGAANGPC